MWNFKKINTLWEEVVKYYRTRNTCKNVENINNIFW